jgi:hypothetical protein
MAHSNPLSCADQRAAQLIPYAPPRVVHDVYAPDEIEALFAAVHRGPGNRLLVAQLFQSAEEIIAATSGGMKEGLTIDHFLQPMFHGTLAQHAACYDPLIEKAFYNSKLLAWARDYFDAEVAVPRQLHYNVGAPMPSADPGHFDSPTFRGLSHTNTPVWLLGLMGNSRLFERYKIQLVAVVTWFWNASDQGGFTYWPDGGHAAPRRIPAPFWNTAVVAENEAMLHRGESIGTPDQWGVEGLSFDSVLEGDPDGGNRWRIRSDDEVIARYRTDQLRWLFHWTAEAYPDREAYRIKADHREDLTLERVFDIFERDLKAEGIKVAIPADPLDDEHFKALLLSHYSVSSPKIYPAEAPVAARAA